MNFKEWLMSEEDEETSSRALWRYGNYCGPGPRLMPQTCDRLYSGKPLPKPINAVDAACQQHDIEYCGCGTNWGAGVIGGRTTPCSRNADELLMQRLAAMKKNLPLSQRIAANTISNYFAVHKRVGRNRENGLGTSGNISGNVGEISDRPPMA